MSIRKTLTVFLFSLSLVGNVGAQKPKTKSPTEPQRGSADSLDVIRKRPALLVVTVLDCSQGDAIVIRTPAVKTYLIDTGPNEKEYGGEFDAGADLIVPFLQSRNVKTIDGILITHPHLDHYGGTLSIMKNFPVRQFIDSGWPTQSPPYFKVLKKVESDELSYRVVQEGDALHWDPHLKVKVYGPRAETYAKDPQKENPNNRSIVLKITYKKISFLFPGDVEIEAEEDLAERFGQKLESQILKAPHHASKTSSTDPFLDAVRPEVAIISCGRGNRFGHPHFSVLERLKQKGIKHLRTDQDGAIEVVSDGNTYTIKSFGIGKTFTSTPALSPSKNSE